jgi:succinate-semialdehyde dehydrogenase/glutarate-semialdehyde dehydrogenase
MEQGTNIGPLITSEAIAKVETLVGDAVKKGAKVLVGGAVDKAGPLFYRPSVVVDVTPDMEIVREEIFGPVAALVRFDTEEDAIKLANDTPFGLAAYLFSQNLARAWRVAEKLDAGMVGVNEGIFSNEVVPFGGVKESGLGREGAAEGLDEYLEIKYICLGGIDA